MTDRRPLATRRELADHLRVSERTISRLVALGTIPVVRVGKLERFDIDAVTGALTTQTARAAKRRTLFERIAEIDHEP